MVMQLNEEQKIQNNYDHQIGKHEQITIDKSEAKGILRWSK